ncbi:phosphopantetheine-binding protein [Thiomonas intermedia]|uniref:phosphopantetheine-binding protein n=1 Tax=Thiomonas intermedia TaxID=926 RepID=UPI0009A4DAC7|nr:phosphopantetheine-binding protein [Thiomonas intermedia]
MSVSDFPSQSADPAFIHEISQLIVTSLGLDVEADRIDPDAPIYGEGLGLDSIDILEIALVISKRFGVQLRADDADNQRIFSSLRHLADHIAAMRGA